MEIRRLILIPLAAIATSGLLLAGCGPSVPSLPKLESNAVVLAFGDSLTHGTGVSPDESYPAVLGKLIDRKVVGSGVPGEISETGLRRLPDVLDEVKPRLLILCHGGNDFLQRLDEGAVARNVRAMANLARERGIAVVIVATPKPGLGVAKVAFYEALGKELTIPVEGDVLAEVLASRKLKSDLVHPNAEGYRRIADAVATLLRRAGAV